MTRYDFGTMVHISRRALWSGLWHFKHEIPCYMSFGFKKGSMQ